MTESFQPGGEEARSFRAKRSDFGGNPENVFFNNLANHIDKRRLESGIVDEEGELNVEKKFRSSSYEILTLDYLKANVMAMQGIDSRVPERYPTDEMYREKLVMHTQHLITNILKEQPDVMFFLDKSARPVAWLVQKLWPLFTEGRDLPEIKFIDIDAGRLFKRGEDDPRPTPEEIYNWEPTEEQIEDVRKIYERDNKKVGHHPEDYKKAWVVDEVSVTNGSSMISQSLLEKAFPGLKVSSKVWMPIEKVQTPSGTTIPTELAPWYSKRFGEGRGVSDPTTNQFLSGHGKNDILTEALRTDIDLLAKDIKEGKQSVRPIIGCYEIDPVTGEEDTSKPKYKVAKFVKSRGRQVRVVTEPAK